MSNVISLQKEREKRESHCYGEAVCMKCGNEWDAVVPDGIMFFECPACRAHKGHFKYHFAPDDGIPRLECNCGCQMFYSLTRTDSLMCANCGAYIDM